jgi:hypothetical protein
MAWLRGKFEMVGKVRMSEHYAIEARVSGEGAEDAETETGSVEREESRDGGGRVGDAEVCCE